MKVWKDLSSVKEISSYLLYVCKSYAQILKKWEREKVNLMWITTVFLKSKTAAFLQFLFSCNVKKETSDIISQFFIQKVMVVLYSIFFPFS